MAPRLPLPSLMHRLRTAHPLAPGMRRTLARLERATPERAPGVPGPAPAPRWWAGPPGPHRSTGPGSPSTTSSPRDIRTQEDLHLLPASRPQRPDRRRRALLLLPPLADVELPVQRDLRAGGHRLPDPWRVGLRALRPAAPVGMVRRRPQRQAGRHASRRRRPGRGGRAVRRQGRPGRAPAPGLGIRPRTR